MPAHPTAMTAAALDSMMSVDAARERYFRENGFSPAAYTDKWFTIKVGPIPVVLPNTQARRAAVKLHDLHHVATGYDTTYRGEAEIGAWEIGAGCGRYGAAWLLNLSAFGIGMWLAPRRVFRAFVRGRRSKSLYDRVFGDDLLAMTVATLKAQLALPVEAPAATVRDAIAFAGWLAASFALLVLTLAPIGLVAWLTIA